MSAHARPGALLHALSTCLTVLERRSPSCSPSGSLSVVLSRCAHCAWRAAPPSSSACIRRIAPG
eukprot:scaffold35906_cov60-Phaeocystis_antarctica.AAC.2